jgi:tripartite-type tricarboxylate transporter receptor subunit TctC
VLALKRWCWFQSDTIAFFQKKQARQILGPGAHCHEIIVEVTVSFFSRLLLALAAGLLCGAVVAQDYPNRPIRLLVPYGAAGGPDLLARVVGPKLSALAGQPVVVDNKPGASGLVGTALAARAANDGYTLLVGDTGPLAVAPSLQKSLNFDVEKDFAPVTLGMTAPLFLTVNSSLGVSNVRELIAYLKANPNKPYGSTGIGSVHHLGMELFLSMTGTKMNHIPYTSFAQSVPALLTGEITLLVAAYPSIQAHIASGKLRAIAVATRNRVSFASNVPTIAESGVPGYENRIDVGFLVPAGTSPAIVKKLNGWLQDALKMSDVVEKLAGSGLLPIPGTPEAYAEVNRIDREKFRGVIKATGVSAE